jgi:hypothetical protein
MLVELKVAPGDHEYVIGKVLPPLPPPQPVTLAKVVCPPVIEPELTTPPPHDIENEALLSLKVPCVSSENEYGPVPGLFIVMVLVEPKPYGPPEPIKVPEALLILHVVSSKNPVPEIVTVKVDALPPVDPVPAVTVPFKLVDCPGQITTSWPAFTTGLVQGGVGQDTT